MIDNGFILENIGDWFMFEVFVFDKGEVVVVVDDVNEKVYVVFVIEVWGMDMNMLIE